MTWFAFWEGVIAGYGIAIPVGAIAILIVDTALRRGFRAGFMAGAGAASADLLYASLAALAGTALAALLAPAADLLRILSGLVLVGLGAHGLWRLRKLRSSSENHEGENRPRRKIYVQFFGLTLLNPLTIAYFGSLILGGNANSIASNGARVAFVLGAALASLSWQSLLALIGAAGHRRLTPRAQLITSVIGNVIVIGLGVRIFWQLVA